MANIELHHTNVSEAAASLRQTGDAMHQDIEQCVKVVVENQTYLAGDLQAAANDFLTALQNADTAMIQDIVDAAGTLDQMHETLVLADRQGAKMMTAL